VACDYSLQKLLEKELVEIKGKSDGVGRPLIYGTSQKFMDYFGINSLQDLPQPKDFSQPEHQIGEEKD
jgi:segregation and condensation protein B